MMMGNMIIKPWIYTGIRLLMHIFILAIIADRVFSALMYYLYITDGIISFISFICYSLFVFFIFIFMKERLISHVLLFLCNFFATAGLTIYAEWESGLTDLSVAINSIFIGIENFPAFSVFVMNFLLSCSLFSALFYIRFLMTGKFYFCIYLFSLLPVFVVGGSFFEYPGYYYFLFVVYCLIFTVNGGAYAIIKNQFNKQWSYRQWFYVGIRLLVHVIMLFFISGFIFILLIFFAFGSTSDIIYFFSFIGYSLFVLLIFVFMKDRLINHVLLFLFNLFVMLAGVVIYQEWWPDFSKTINHLIVEVTQLIIGRYFYVSLFFSCLLFSLLFYIRYLVTGKIYFCFYLFFLTSVILILYFLLFIV